MALSSLRSHNERAVLSHVRSGASSRAELALRTGLTHQAVSKIVARLIAAGLLEETGDRAPTGGVGKPRTLLRLVPSGAYGVGAHVDRDELRVVLADLTGAVTATSTVALPEAFTPDDVVDALAREVSRMRVDRVLGLGIGIAGPLDHRDGVVHDATGLPGWHDVPLRQLVADRIELPIIVDKDVNAAVVAEAWRRPLTDAAVVFAGTGLGAGLLLDGKVHRGARSGAGEFGHTTIQLDGPLCACGRRGCVEAVHRASDRVRAIEVLGTAVMDLVRLLDLAHIVLSGRSVLAAPQEYLDGVRACAPPSDWLPVDVSVTTYGHDLVAVGAAMGVLGELFAHP